MDWLKLEIDSLKVSNIYRERVVSDRYLNLCSNDYLGLSKNKEVIEAGISVLLSHGVGSGASQLVSGYSEYHKKLEEKLSVFKEIPSCILFGSGYMANVGVIPAIGEEGDLILSDELNHASIVDGCRLSKAEKRIFPHLNYDELENVLQEERGNYRKIIVVTDSVFSMEGDIADLKRLSEICDRYDAILYIDDAHATGILGKGKGSLQEFNIKWKENIIVMGTLSKALGCYGAFVCGSEDLTKFIINKVRTIIFSTSIPPSLCASAIKSIEIIEENVHLVEELRRRAEVTYNIFKEENIEIKWHGTPILPIIVGDEGKALHISKQLMEKNILLRAIRYPAVPKGKARLRLTVSLSIEEGLWFRTIEQVLDILKKHIG